MSDVGSDQQTGQGADDFVGSATVAGFLQKAGLLGGVSGADAFIFRSRMDKYDSKGFGGNWLLGMDLDGNGSIDLFMKITDKNGTQTISFAQPGTGTNTSPSTTSIITPWAGTIALGATTYNYQEVTTNVFNATNDAYVTFAISFANLQSAIQTYATGFSGFTVNYSTRISFIASTSTQGNAINQDLYGTTGNLSSTLTWAQLGAVSAFALPDGTIPEPSTYAQIGLMLLTVGVVAYRRRLRPARSAMGSKRG